MPGEWTGRYEGLSEVGRNNAKYGETLIITCLNICSSNLAVNLPWYGKHSAVTPKKFTHYNTCKAWVSPKYSNYIKLNSEPMSSLIEIKSD